MVIKLKDIQEKFNQLLGNLASRESVSNWASSVRESDDYEPLVYEPADCEDQIWDALGFLHGFDLKISPDKYLHDMIDIKEYMESHGL